MGYKTIMLITDRATQYMWGYFLQPNRTANDVITALKDLVATLERQYSIKTKVVECDNEITQRLPAVNRWLESQHIKTEPSPPHTQALNGAAERSGGMLKNTMRAMTIGANLLHSLWREIGKTAIYLLNRTLCKGLQWKTPYEAIHTKPGGQRRRPDISHLRVFGCRAYVMTPTA